jgi:hypothetical protein
MRTEKVGENSYPEGVDRVISVRPRWFGGADVPSLSYVVARIWHDGQVDLLGDPSPREEAVARAKRQARLEKTVYMVSPEEPPHEGHAAPFGEVPGIRPGQRFRRKQDLRSAGIHRQPQRGIDWTSEGALAIVFSSGYADDAWSADEAWYTGEGGQDEPGGRQVSDQELVRGNKALIANFHEGLPVRVIRRSQGDGDYEFVYEGIYYVVDYTYGPGGHGPKVYRFLLRRT